VISRLKNPGLAAVCLLLTQAAALAALPSNLGIQPLFPDFLVFRADDQWHAVYTLILTRKKQMTHSRSNRHPRVRGSPGQARR
jgi:hypothetical protein